LSIAIASGLYHGDNTCVYVTTSVTPSIIDVASYVSIQNKKFLTSAALSRGSFPTLAAGGITVITGSHTHDTAITPSGTISTPTFSGTTATITVS
jgi:hypothetical protein